MPCKSELYYSACYLSCFEIIESFINVIQSLESLGNQLVDGQLPRHEEIHISWYVNWSLDIALDTTEDGFAKKQQGFIGRTFAKAEGNEWVEVIRWQSMADAEAASKAAMESPACAPMFGMIDEPSVKMMHFEILS